MGEKEGVWGGKEKEGRLGRKCGGRERKQEARREGRGEEKLEGNEGGGMGLRKEGREEGGLGWGEEGGGKKRQEGSVQRGWDCFLSASCPLGLQCTPLTPAPAAHTLYDGFCKRSHTKGRIREGGLLRKARHVRVLKWHI